MLVFGAFQLDTHARVVYRDDVPVALTPKQVDTLMVLVAERGQLVERERLIAEVWQGAFIEESGLTRNISALRKALGAAGDIEFIETVPKRGYRFVAPVSRQTVPVGEPETVVAPVDRGPEPVPIAAPPAGARQSGRGLAWMGALALLVAAAGLYLLTTRRPAAPPDMGMNSLAVLPFRLTTDDPADKYLSMGLGDLLTTRLAGLASIAVRPTSSTQAFAGVDPVAAGRELAVDAVVDGSLRRDGDRLRLAVQVIDVKSGMPLFAGTFDERAADALLLENALTDSVVGLLVPRLVASDRSARAHGGSANAQAVDAYLRGRYLWSTRDASSIESAIAAFEQAVALDPSFALAYAGLSHAYIVQGDYQYRWPRDVFPRAKAAALRALELDGSLADAHAALGEIAWEYDWDFTTAEASLTRAAQLAPNDPTVHQWLAEFYAAMGRVAESDAAVEKAILLAPRDFAPSTERVILRYWTHRFDDVIRLADQAEGLGGFSAIPQLYKFWALTQLGRFDEAMKAFGRFGPALQGLPIHDAIQALHEWRSGRQDDARRRVADIARRRQHEYVEAIILASIHVEMGETDRALGWLSQAIEDRSAMVPLIPMDPFYAPLHGDPQFRDLLQRAGLGWTGPGQRVTGLTAASPDLPAGPR